MVVKSIGKATITTTELKFLYGHRALMVAMVAQNDRLGTNRVECMSNTKEDSRLYPTLLAVAFRFAETFDCIQPFSAGINQGSGSAWNCLRRTKVQGIVNIKSPQQLDTIIWPGIFDTLSALW